MNKQILAICAVLFAASPLIGGCLGGHGAVISETGQKAVTALSRGIRAEHKGEYVQAEQYLQQSLALSTSIEDSGTTAAALINLSRLQRLQGNPVAAIPYIDRALVVVVPGTALASEATYEKALVELARGSAQSALLWAEKARLEEKGDSIGSRYNLSARISLLLGRPDEAEVLAQRGFKESRSAGQDEETANALRLLGMVARERQRFDDSSRLLQEALQFDKRIGKSSKIAIDLEELARTAEKRGRQKEAVGYLKRAVDVHRGDGRVQQAQRLCDHIAELERSAGELPPSP